MLFFFCNAEGQDSPSMRFRHLESRSGLSDINTRCILKDSYGLIWIGTENGLSRFDGSSTYSYRNISGDSNSICGNYIVHIIEDKNRDLWIGTQNGLARYNRASDNFTNFQKLKTDRPLASNFYAYPFFIDQQSFLWAYLGGEIFKVNIQDKAATFVSTHANGKVFINQAFYTPLRRMVTNSMKGFYLIGIEDSKEKSVQRYPKNLKDDPVLARMTIADSYLEKDSLYWLCSDAGLIAFNPMNGNYQVYGRYQNKDKITVNCIAPLPGRHGQYLVGTEGEGLLLFDNNTKKFSAQYLHDYLDPQSIAGNTISAIRIDNNDNLFLVLPGKGVDYANMKQIQFKHFFSRGIALEHGLDNNVTCIVDLPGLPYYIAGTGNSGIVIFHQATHRITATLLSRHGMTKLVRLDKHRVLAETNKGLFFLLSYVNGQWQTKKVILSGLNNISGRLQINHLLVIGDSSLLAATDNGLMKVAFQSDNGLHFTQLDSVNRSVEWPHFQRIIQYSPQQFFLQTYYTNIYSFLFKKSMFGEGKELGRTPFLINGHLKDGRNVWLATSFGLWEILLPEFQLKQKGMAETYCTGIAMDRNKNLWITSTNGIIKFDVTHNTKYKFTPEDGLQDYVFNSQAILQTEEGKIIAGGVNGINEFDPNQIQNTNQKFDVHLNRIEVNDQVYKAAGNPLITQKLELSHLENNLTFFLTPVSYTEPLEHTLHYLLQGYDSKPISIKGRAVIRYPRLPPGNYKLLYYGNDATTAKTLSIIIHPPFWNTWWFQSIIFVLITALVLAIFLFRISIIRKAQLQRLRLMVRAQEEERRRIARDLHDDFGARLSTLKMYLQAIGKQTPEQVKNLSGHAASMIDTTIQELRNILFNLSPKTLEEHGLSAALHDLADNINRMLPLECQIDTKGMKCRPDMATEFSIYRVCQELINNTIKHAAATHIYISLVTYDHALVLLFEEDGNGFDINTCKKGYGLNNIETHIQSMKGSLLVDSSPGKGLAVTITIPLSPKHKNPRS